MNLSDFCFVGTLLPRVATNPHSIRPKYTSHSELIFVMHGYTCLTLTAMYEWVISKLELIDAPLPMGTQHFPVVEGSGTKGHFV
jgi:hypothetical protein